MGHRKVLIDTSVIIDYIRKKQKEKSDLYKLFDKQYILYISAVSCFELYAGLNETNRKLTEIILAHINRHNFDGDVAQNAALIYNNLKKRNQIIEIRDIFIAASAASLNIPLATKNIKHFARIQEIELLESII
jgi:tRNA(fMet)-specific endonuclease VapC